MTKPTAKGCAMAADSINNQTTNQYSVTCNDLDAGNCVRINVSSSGRCSNEPVGYDKISAAFFTGTLAVEKGTATTATAPELGVAIPGISFPKQLSVVNNKIQVSYLAIYLAGFQKYLIGIGIVAAAIMLVWGGFKYLLSSTGAKISDARETIKDALMGMVLVLGAVVILLNVNPDTTKPSVIQVEVTRRAGTPENAQDASNMVNDSARKSLATGTVEGEAPPGSPTLAKPVKDSLDEGVVLNAQGLPVAQDNCPTDMVAIEYSENYKPEASGTVKNPRSFCIDRYEAPNRRGIKPFNGVLGIEAAWWCDQRNKRLCTEDEWMRACFGPDGKNTYGYGPTFIPGWFKSASPSKPRAPCNYDSVATPKVLRYLSLRDEILGAFDLYYPSQPDGSILTPENLNTSLQDAKYSVAYYAAKDMLSKANMVESSGSRVECVTAEGVFDMPGNVQEIAIARDYSNKTIEDLENFDGSYVGKDVGNIGPYAWMNFYWSPVAHLANVNAVPSCSVAWGASGHALSWRPHENGFRCCMDLDTDVERAAKAEVRRIAEAKTVEDDAKAVAKREKSNICGTTPASDGMTCTKISNSLREGKNPGQFTCLTGYCMAKDRGGSKCCKKNE